jgi:hypothetical protein
LRGRGRAGSPRHCPGPSSGSPPRRGRAGRVGGPQRVSTVDNGAEVRDFKGLGVGVRVMLRVWPVGICAKLRCGDSCVRVSVFHLMGVMGWHPPYSSLQLVCEIKRPSDGAAGTHLRLTLFKRKVEPDPSRCPRNRQQLTRSNHFIASSSGRTAIPSGTIAITSRITTIFGPQKHRNPRLSGPVSSVSHRLTYGIYDIIQTKNAETSSHSSATTATFQ